ncbi:MAG: tRNA pseudouridine(13) synthase TruD [Planctomycetes bacterium]|nr:tRNA pseudouridine(13) synthase TruD [Planctomycetota bacterium]
MAGVPDRPRWPHGSTDAWPSRAPGRTRAERAVTEAPRPDHGSLLPSPLPTRGLLPAGTLGGRIRERPEDFLVEELPLYEPSGEGEHVYVGVQKQDVQHVELVSILSRHFNVPASAIGFAGMKDRRAVTRQTVSIHLPGREPAAVQLQHPQVMLLWMTRHANKLRRGHLAGNRFAIRIRGLDPLKATVVWSRLKDLARIGVPDFYGPQRFGYRGNNHIMGLHVLHARWQDALDELLGLRGTVFPERQRERREFFARGEFAAALDQWGRNDHAERSALRTLITGKSPECAVLSGGSIVRDFWIAALQSAVFNRTVLRRLEAGTLGTLLDGDRAYHHRSGRSFRISAAMLEAGSDVLPRLHAFELSPSGLMPGCDFGPAEGVPGEIERTACADFGIDPALFASGALAPTGARRPLRVAVTNAQCEGGFDEHGPYIRVAFDLPAGAFATVVLKELLGDQLTEGTAADRADEQGTS